jgi:glycerol-3-phosphate dehydrogenase
LKAVVRTNILMEQRSNMDQPKAVIIGAGFTGMATAYDLAQRGFQVTVVERGEIASGTSGRTHGLLHSGGRYCVNDKESAIECIEENTLLRKICGQCIEPNGGYFVALNDEDVEYGKKFAAGAQECGIRIEEFTGDQLRKIEPAVSPEVIKAYSVPDGTFDPLRLAWSFGAAAVQYKAQFLTYHIVDGFTHDGQGKINGVTALVRADGSHTTIRADIVINATGAWAGQLAPLAGISVSVKPTPGVMVAVDQRLTETVINRLTPPDDGDIVIPQRRMLVIGTTSFEAKDVDYIPLDKEQTNLMIERGSAMIPGIAKANIRGIYMSSRPLVGAGAGRSLTRTFKTFDHEEMDGIKGIVSVVGGKATTSRLMAEKVTDLVCKKMGMSVQCQTRDSAMPSYRKFFTRQ